MILSLWHKSCYVKLQFKHSVCVLAALGTSPKRSAMPSGDDSGASVYAYWTWIIDGFTTIDQSVTANAGELLENPELTIDLNMIVPATDPVPM